MEKLKEFRKSLVNKYLSNNERGEDKSSDDWAIPTWYWVSHDLEAELKK